MIRLAEEKDTQSIVELGKEMIEEGRYSYVTYSPEKVKEFVRRYINSPNKLLLVSEIKGRICGFFFGFIAPFNFSNDLFASEELWYMQKESRGKRDGVVMIKQFIEWSKRCKAVEVNLTITLCVANEIASKVAKGCGFVPEGEVHKMRLV